VSNGSIMIAQTIQEARKLLLYSNHHPEELYKEHEIIFKAIKKQNPDEAHTSMYNHLERVNQDLFESIDNLF